MNMASRRQWAKQIIQKNGGAILSETDTTMTYEYPDDVGYEIGPQTLFYTESPPVGQELCPKCYTWKSYGPGQEHFGFCYDTICEIRHGGSCDCEHHQDEIWSA